MKALSALAKSQNKELKEDHPQPSGFWPIQNRTTFSIYALAVAASISTWFIALRAPLRLDETGSYWQISAGFSEIWPRQFSVLSFPAYSYFLWLSTKIIGSSEIALRIPSVLAMLGAVCLLYLGAREMFERDIALIAVIVFCLNPIVLFAAIDIRPYAFGVLVTNAAILILFRLRNDDSSWLAALFGLTAAGIIWFHYLFGVILPALVLCFIVFKVRDRRTFLRQFSVALAAFTLAMLPVIPGVVVMLRTSRTHVYEVAPTPADLARTLAPGFLLFVLVGTALVAFLVFAAGGRRHLVNRIEGWQVWVCISLAFIPILILYGVSVGTSIHTFASRHRLEAVPGIALCWALVLSRFQSRILRLLFCVAMVATTVYQCFTAPLARMHENSMKDAIALAEGSASIDDAPVVMCSGFVESNFAPMPSMENVRDSVFFAPLTYYKLSVPVVPLPQLLNEEAIQDGSAFLREAAQKHERFLVVGDKSLSYKTLDWFVSNAGATHSVHDLGLYGGMEVLEFVPHTDSRP